jgi:hypothetical protein
VGLVCEDANFGELALAAVTLIYIRNRSAATNARHPEDFPYEIDAVVVQNDRNWVALELRER